MAQIWAQDAHCATDCSGSKSGAVEIGSRPEIRTELNLINRNLQFITMTRKRLTMTDILVSARSEITQDLSSDLSSLKISSGANPYEMAHWGSECRVPVCSLLCKIRTKYTEGEVPASYWPLEALCCLVIGQEPSLRRVLYANCNSVGCDSAWSGEKNAYLRAT